MKKYTYKAKNYKNSIYKGIITSKNENELREILNRKDLYLVSYKECKEKRLIHDKLKIEDLAFFCNQMAVMLKSKATLSQSLKIIVKSCENKRLVEILTEGISSLDEGSSFSKVLEKYKDIPLFFLNVIKIGERTGNLEKSFADLSKYYDKSKENKRKLSGAIMYPLFLLAMGLVVLVLLMIKIVPIFTNIFNESNAKLPLITKVMISISNHLTKNITIYCYIFLVISVIILIFIRTTKGKFIWNYLKVKIPFFSKPLKLFNSQTLCNGLLMFLESGSNIATGIETMGKLTTNVYLQQKLISASQAIKEGVRVTIAIKQINYYPQELIEMLAIGASCGKIEDVLDSLNKYFSNEYEYSIKRIISKIEPIMIIGIGGLLLVVILSIFIPMFSIMNIIGSNI